MCSVATEECVGGGRGKGVGGRGRGCRGSGKEVERVGEGVEGVRVGQEWRGSGQGVGGLTKVLGLALVAQQSHLQFIHFATQTLIGAVRLSYVHLTRTGTISPPPTNSISTTPHHHTITLLNSFKIISSQSDD